MAEAGGDTGRGGGSEVGTGSVSSALWGPGWLPSLGLFLNRDNLSYLTGLPER